MASVGHLPTDLPSRDEHGRLALGQKVAGTMSLLGAVTAYVGVATLGMSALAGTAQLVLAIGLTVLGLTLWLAPPNRRLAQAASIWAVLSISLMIGTSDEFGTTPFFYLWPAVFVAYFCSLRFLAFTLATIVVTLIPALAASDVSLAVGADLFIGTTLSVGLMAGLVGLMQAREVRLTERLAHAAHTDPLTGLLNRRGFDPRFAELIAASDDLGRAISVVMFDLDHFKRFNDEHGHAAGDEALRRVAGILTAQCREVDLVGRLGGEEFAVVLPGAAAVDALSYAERVAWALGTEQVDDALRISTSSGIGSYSPGEESVSALVLRADEALYAAKSAGRARSAWWVGGEIAVGDVVSVPDPAGVTPVPVPTVPREYVMRRNDLLELEARQARAEPERAEA